MPQIIQNKGIQTISSGMKILKNFRAPKSKANGKVYCNMNFVKQNSQTLY
jgi:hypothetical protein